MQANWTPQAIEMADSIIRYTVNAFGKSQADKLRLTFAKLAKQLESFPYMGAIEPYLADLQKEYRFVPIFKVLKVIYHVADTDHLYIVAVWNCRQSPYELKTTLSAN